MDTHVLRKLCQWTGAFRKLFQWTGAYIENNVNGYTVLKVYFKSVSSA